MISYNIITQLTDRQIRRLKMMFIKSTLLVILSPVLSILFSLYNDMLPTEIHTQLFIFINTICVVMFVVGFSGMFKYYSEPF